MQADSELSASCNADAEENVVVVFARAPVAGETKTRLIPLLGAQGAVDAHMQLLSDQLRRLDDLACDAECRKQIWATEESAEIDSLATRHNFEVHIQPEGDLGLRMSEVCGRALTSGRSVVLLGSDCQVIDAEYVRSAWVTLRSHDIVIGPAEDGGYGLIGMKSLQPVLFRDIAWGTSSVLADTLQRAASANLSVSCLPEIWDVDTAEDWQRWTAE